MSMTERRSEMTETMESPALNIVGQNHNNLPVIQWNDDIQTTVIVVTFGRGRLIIARNPYVYYYPDGDGNGYTDGWCYESLFLALGALASWNPLVDPEPEGWVKNTSTERRRLNGDARYEYRTFEEECEARKRMKQDSI